MQDLIFTANSFSYPVDKKQAFRNYLAIIQPEIVNMPNLGFDMTLWDHIKFDQTTNEISTQDERTELTINTIVGDVSQYNIVVKAYYKFFRSVDSTLTFDDVVLG